MMLSRLSLALLVALPAGLAVAAPKAKPGKTTAAKPAATKPAAAKADPVLPGGNSKKPINIVAAKLDYFDKERKLIYTGDVVATQGDSILKSTVLTIFLAPKKPDTGTEPAAAGGSSTSQVQRMIAQGPVTMLQRDQIGTGDNGEYDKVHDTVVLTGNVTLTQGPNITKGDRLVYNTKTGQAVVTGKRVVSMFDPNANTDSSATPPAAADTKPAAAKPASTKRAKSARGE